MGMASRGARRAATLLVAATLGAVPDFGSVQAADWPGYRGDNARRGSSSDSLQTPLHLQWTYVPRHRRRPAWPEPCKEVQRMAFDYAPQVAVTHGLVIFGSSADHKVYALDTADGAERWRFFTGGPVCRSRCRPAPNRAAAAS